MAASAAAPQLQGGVRRLSIDEAVAMALEQNLNLQVDRIDPQIQDYSISVARSSWTPALLLERHDAQPDQPAHRHLRRRPTAITNERLTSQAGVQQVLPWGGASYTAAWNSGRVTTNNVFSSFNPQLNSTVSANYTQPLLRNFKIDATRQQVLVSRKNREISDVQLQQSIAVTTRNVKNAYWDLVFAINNLAVQRQSLQLAQQSFRDNRARVEIGTMAPLDIVQAEAEVAQREEGVILAEAAISRAEDTLRALISNPGGSAGLLEHAPRAGRRGRPSSRCTVDTDAAVRNALANRTDLVASRKQIEANDISIRYFRNQSLPDVNALVNYSAIGLAGTQFNFGQGFPPPVLEPDAARLLRRARRRVRLGLPDLVAAAAGELSDRRVERRSEPGARAAAEHAGAEAAPEPRAAGRDADPRTWRATCRPTPSASSRPARRARSPRSGSRPRRRSSRPA